MSVATALLGVLRLDGAVVADKRLVHFDRAAVGTEVNRTVIAHCLTDTVRHEPRGLVCYLKNAVKLVAADALFAGHHQVDSLQPLEHFDVAFLKDRTLADGELLAALAALPQAVTLFALGVLFAGLRADALKLVGAIDHAAMRADRAVRPQNAFDVRKRCGFVMHVGFG